MKIYVASSWRNNHQPDVVKALREDGHTVYDYKKPEGEESKGFAWSEIDVGWQNWNREEYLLALQNPIAKHGFNRDMTALFECQIYVYVMPCGVSASLEAGWAKGRGKKLIVYVPELKEPDLMVKMADYLCTELDEVKLLCTKIKKGEA